jgi:hypothetical protein
MKVKLRVRAGLAGNLRDLKMFFQQTLQIAWKLILHWILNFIQLYIANEKGITIKVLYFLKPEIKYFQPPINQINIFNKHQIFCVKLHSYCIYISCNFF